MTGLKLTTCEVDIVTVDVVTTPVVASLASGPPSMFHEAILEPVPEDRPQTPFAETVKESPYLYHPSDVSEGSENVIPFPPLTESRVW